MKNFRERTLIERCCPQCSSDKAEIIFSLKKEDFYKNNPTHNLRWFDEIDIPENFEFDFLKCSNCDFLYTKYRLNDRYNFQFYNEGILEERSKTKIFTKSKRLFNISVWAKLLELSVDKHEIKLLDFGGGWGDFLATAKTYGVDTYGLEYDERKISFAKDSGIRMGDFELIKEQAPFDCFICNQVLEHLDDPKESLNLLRSSLKDGAFGFVGVPNFNKERVKALKLQIEQNETITKELNPFGHLNYFSPQSLGDMLDSCGFKVVGQLEEKSLLDRFVNKFVGGSVPTSTMVFVRTY